jgi:hypothetical protein
MAIMPPKKRRELGDFLRAHRARLSPASLGLPAIGRRRTPGLRREEVAQACGMSPTWYTWLEQGRDNRRLAARPVGAGARAPAHAGRARLSLRAGRPARSHSVEPRR